jgi:Acyl-CoA dehydrogenase, C-terminal domain
LRGEMRRVCACTAGWVSAACSFSSSHKSKVAFVRSLVFGRFDFDLHVAAEFAATHPIQRAWRDIHFASMHVSLNPEQNFAHFGRTELGLPRDSHQPFF